MTIAKTIGAMLLAAAVGVAAYAAGTATRAARAPVATTSDAARALMDWLRVPANERSEFEQHDPAFAADLKALRGDLAVKRTELAATLDDPNSADDVIRAKHESLIAANGALERRVVDYLLAVRHHLTKDQQRQLFCMCAEGVRRGPYREAPDGIGRGQGGQGRGMGPGPGAGQGQGPGPGAGGGGGGGNGYRGGRAP